MPRQPMGRRVGAARGKRARLDKFLHASGRGRENRRNGFDADARPAHNGGVEHRVRSEGGSEFRHSIFSDNSNPVFAWFAR
jgi:hypothetical protein